MSLDFSLLPDDLLLKILSLLPSSSDPRLLPRLSCVCRRLRLLSSSLLLLPPLALPLPPPTLHKLAVCCPGLAHSGVLFHQHSPDFGLSMEIGPDLDLDLDVRTRVKKEILPSTDNSSCGGGGGGVSVGGLEREGEGEGEVGSWSLFDDLYLDSSYDLSEAREVNNNNSNSNNNNNNSCVAVSDEVGGDGGGSNNGDESVIMASLDQLKTLVEPPACSSSVSKKKRKKESDKSKKNRWVGPIDAHLAGGNWSLSREQGSKLLASRFRGDSLYICDWPGCVHVEQKRKYMLFRGVFKDFKRSRVFRTIVDSKRGRIKLDCAYCKCGEMWDLHSAFCLRGFIGFHEDGEPVVRAYVCENGHVAGAWTERPMYG